MLSTGEWALTLEKHYKYKIFLFYQFKHMFWVLKNTISLRQNVGPDLDPLFDNLIQQMAI